MRKDLKAVLITAGIFAALILIAVLLIVPFMRTTGTVVKNNSHLYNINVPEISAQVEAVQNGQQITGTSDPLDSATCEMSLDYTVRFYVLSKEYDVDYRASLEIPYSESSRYYLTEGSKIDLYYNPIFPSNFKLIF